jgi:abortive infection bacteriophage resistance protein
MNKIAYSTRDQTELLKRRGMLFESETGAFHILKHIGYYRLKGY